MKIDTGNHAPIKQMPFRIPPNLREELEKQIREMLKFKIIEHSRSPWCSPILFVRKENGEWRLCVDFRKINAITRKDSYPWPRIEDTIELLKDSGLSGHLNKE